MFFFSLNFYLAICTCDRLIWPYYWSVFLAFLTNYCTCVRGCTYVRGRNLAGTVVWNSLPAAVRHADSLHSFRRRLKSHFFSLCFNDWQCNALRVRFRAWTALNSLLLLLLIVFHRIGLDAYWTGVYTVAVQGVQYRVSSVTHWTVTCRLVRTNSRHTTSRRTCFDVTALSDISALRRSSVSRSKASKVRNSTVHLESCNTLLTK